MARKRRIRKIVELEEAGYPTLKEQRATRRQFLGVMGASLAAGGLCAACGQAMGPGSMDDAGAGAGAGSDATTPLPDAAGQLDSSVRAPGGEQWPGYYTVRIPIEGELTAHLSDYIAVVFHVDAATYNQETYRTLQESSAQTEQVCQDLVSEHSYDELTSPESIASVEDSVLEALDEQVMTLDGHSTSTIELVALHISRFEEEPTIVGAISKPYYP